MRIGNIDITKEQMPSYEAFQSNPHRLYLLIQDQLNNGLQITALQQQQTMNSANNQGMKRNGQN